MLRRAALVHYFGLRRQAGFDREPREKRFTKTVNGLNFKAARRIQYFREKAPGRPK